MAFSAMRRGAAVMRATMCSVSLMNLMVTPLETADQSVTTIWDICLGDITDYWRVVWSNFAFAICPRACGQRRYHHSVMAGKTTDLRGERRMNRKAGVTKLSRMQRAQPRSASNRGRADEAEMHKVDADHTSTLVLSASDSDDVAVSSADSIPIEVSGGFQPALSPQSSRCVTSIGRYMVYRQLGRGGMGTVYDAYDPELDRRIAIKLLRYTISTHHRKRMEREARALAKMSHPNVVRVYDAGVHEDRVFVAMELVEGQTLKEWCSREPKPHWRQILQAYLDAAHGLAAAHAKEIVHRDIKPANLLIGGDGRVRVADFGLAAAFPRQLTDDGDLGEGDFGEDADALDDTTADGAATDGPGTPDDSSSMSRPSEASKFVGRLDDRFTITGTIIGTLAFMAPEQHLAEEVGPPADQYSLCVSLYLGLYGHLPFTKSGRVKHAEGWLMPKLGPPATPELTSEIPAWIHRVLARGMAVHPQDRYPSIEALIEALSSDPRKRRGRIMRVAAVTGIVAMATAALVISNTRPFAEHRAATCQGLEREMVEVWNEDAQERIHAAFTATNLPYAADSATRTTQVLDTYADSWITMRTETCTATRIHESQSEDTMYLRLDCLDRRRLQLTSLIELFADQSDTQVVAKAVSAAHALLPIDYCGDVEALRAAVPPPEDPRVRARVEALQPDLDSLAIFYKAGKYQEGMARGQALVAAIDTLDYAPLRAQTAFWLATLQEAAGLYDAAEGHYRIAIENAARAKDDVLLTRAWAGFIDTVGEHQGRNDEALLFVDALITASIRALDDDSRATALSSAAHIHYRVANYAQAEADFAEAVAIHERTGGPYHLKLVPALSGMATMLTEMGRYEEAEAMLARAVAIREQALGSRHPDLARAYNNLSVLYSDMGRFRRALAFQRRALAIREYALGSDHPRVATSLNNLAVSLRQLGEHNEALAIHRRAIAIREKHLGPHHRGVGISLNNMGDVLLALGSYDEAQRVYERAVEIFTEALGPDHPHVMFPLSGLARVLIRRRQLDIAEPMAKRALAVFEHVNGPEHPRLTRPLRVLAELQLARKKPDASMALLERALSLALANPSTAAHIKYSMATTLWATGKQRPRAIALATEARAHYETVGNQSMAETVGQWLVAHRRKLAAATK